MGIFGAVLATGLAPVISLFILSNHCIGVAAYGVVANLSLVVISIYTGIAQGTQPILSRIYGYGEHESQKQILGYALKTMLVISCGIYLFFLFSANSIVRVFNSEQNIQLQQIAETGLKLYFTAISFVGYAT